MTIDITEPPAACEETAALRSRVAELEQHLHECQQTDTSTSFFAQMPDMCCIASTDGTFKHFNPAWHHATGYAIEELQNKPIIDFIHPDDRTATLQVMQRVFGENQTTLSFDHRLLHKDGSAVWVRLSATPDPARGVAYCVAREISQEREATAELRASEQRYQRMVANVPGMVYQFALHPDGAATFPFASDGIRAIYGVEAEVARASAAPLVEMTHSDDMARFHQSVIDSATTLEPWVWEGRIVMPSGEEKWINAAARPERLEDGTVLWDGLILDVTERKRTQVQLAAAALQEDTIRAQQAALEELSTPLIPISENTVVMPLIGTMDSRRAQQVMDTLLHGVAETSARTAILDITGVSVVDTQVANALIRAAQAVKLLGAQVILTGIRPEVAQTLVGLGVDLSSIVTLSTLQSGIALALKK